MVYGKAYTTKERILFAIMGLSLATLITCLGLAIDNCWWGTRTIVILSVSGGVFLITLIIYLVPLIKAGIVTKESIIDSLKNIKLEYHSDDDYYSDDTSILDIIFDKKEDK